MREEEREFLYKSITNQPNKEKKSEQRVEEREKKSELLIKFTYINKVANKYKTNFITTRECKVKQVVRKIVQSLLQVKVFFAVLLEV